MNNIDLRNEYAKAKNRAFVQGCEGGFRADYTEWLEQKLANNTEIIGSVSNCSHEWKTNSCDTMGFALTEYCENCDTQRNCC